MKKERGMFLISSFLVLSLIGTFSLAVYFRSTTVSRTTERAENRIRAFQLAEAGLDRAIVELEKDSTYTGQGYTALGNKGGYEAQVDTPDPVNNPDVRRITATGHSPAASSASYAYERRQVVSHISLNSQSGWKYSVFSDTNIDMSGNVKTDSYDSSKGPYNPAQAGKNGDIGTNTTQAHNIALSGNVQVQGDAIVGPGGDPNRVIVASGNSTIAGTQTAATQSQPLQSATIPDSLQMQDIKVKGNEILTLPGGTYWAENFVVSGNGRVNFTGPATVYISDEIKISGNGIGTAGNLPSNLKILVADDCEVSLSGNSSFYGWLYAPDSRIDITGNGELFGAVVGKSIAMSGNGKVHLDEALNSTGTGSSGSSHVLAWTET